MSLRFTAQAARSLRLAIHEAGGVEVFAIGEVEAGVVVGVTVTCRGTEDRVPALLERPRTGQVVIHNHPSGDLRPSGADMRLAGLYGDDGVGVVITDSPVTRSNWVVEPHADLDHAVATDDVERFFQVDLPRVLPGYEARGSQLDMAHRVAAALSEDRPIAVEAGTGTGKSLAYLVPAALWAIANDKKVVISTFTRALQAQLITLDIPVLARAGLEVRTALLQGRSNYVCKRRLGLAHHEDRDQSPDDRAGLDTLLKWEATSQDGRRTDLPFAIDPVLWERIESDSDLTLRVRCEHYHGCHYYTARRRAAGAHLVVVNHALLMADRALRGSGAPGVIPNYNRAILDEAHHLEDAATGAVSNRLTLRGVQRATAPLLSRKRRRGALDRLITHTLAGKGSPLLSDAAEAGLTARVVEANDAITALRGTAEGVLETLSARVLPPDGTPVRITAEVEHSDLWHDAVRPALGELRDALEGAAGVLDRIDGEFDEVRVPDDRIQPLLDLRRARRRLGDFTQVIQAFEADDPDMCRWLAPSRSRRAVTSASAFVAPVEVAPTLRRILWEPLPGVGCTSATLATAGSFAHFLRRTGLRNCETGILPSPFDHFSQALLALPRDLPPPDHPGYLTETGRVIAEAVALSAGGTFVLCTSYRAVDHFARTLRTSLPAGMPVLAQGRGGRSDLLDRFRQSPRSVLVGTDSFWEGVSVKGHQLRQVIIPRLPFRVPTEPLLQARHERTAAQGMDPFRAFTLPEAVLRLRQGYGRLIRTKTDRGVVLILDRRVHERRYGAVMLRSLPPARRLSAPWRRVREELVQFWREPAA